MIDNLYSKLNELRYSAFQFVINDNYDDYENAFDEGCIWLELGFQLENNNYHNRQAYVALTLSSELFLKAILIKNNKKISHIHDLDLLFMSIDKKSKEEIIENIVVENLDIIDNKNRIIGKLNTFEEYLNYISKDFVDLRYDFEKNKENNSTIVPTKFINDFAYELYKYCKNYII